MCGKDFLSVMMTVVESDIPARSLVERAMLDRHQVDDSGGIIKIESLNRSSWRIHLHELEEIHSVDPLIKFVLYTDISSMWWVHTVREKGRKFLDRLGLPKAWRGLRDVELESVSKILGSRFVHADDFVGGADTYEGVLKMA